MTNKRKIKTKKKDIIYTQAALLFKEKGYKAASMRDLAERVNLKVSSLYSHIGSKEELLQKICFDSANLFIEGMRVIELQPISNLEKIRALIGLHVDITMTNPISVTIFNDEWKHLTDDSHELNLTQFLSLRKDYENRFKRIIMGGIENKQIKELDPSVVLYTIISSVKWLHDWHKPTRKVDAALLKAQITGILLTGISDT